MKRLTNFLKENKHFLGLLLFIPLLIWFYFCQKLLQPKYIMHSRIDDFIPFYQVFIIPYLIWFPYMAFGFLYLGLRDRKSFIRLLIFILSGMSISYIIFIVFPSGQDLRPVIETTDIFSKLVMLIQGIDPPANVFPSIHVLNTIGVHYALASYKDVSKRVRVVSFINMILICASTVFIKQHSIIDVFGGIVLAIILIVCIYVIPDLSQRRRNNNNVLEEEKIRNV